MAKSLLLATNTTSQTVTATNPIVFNNIVRRFGNCITLNGSTITLNSAGYYDIDFGSTFTTGATGDVTINILQNGTQIQGATATETVGTANTAVHAISISTTVRVYCPLNSTLTVVIGTGSPSTTLSNVSIRVEKI